jgi:membrane protease YdiL (CAAX protease family)
MVERLRNEIGREAKLKRALFTFAYLLLVWSLYRLFFTFPEWLEEVVVKPLVWIVPMGLLVYGEGASLKEVGINFENFSRTAYFILGLGVLFVFEAGVLNYIKHGGFNFAGEIGGGFWWVFGLSLVTATTEEVVYRGYIFSRVWDGLGNEWFANIITSVGWVVLHFPVYIFGLSLSGGDFLATSLLVFVFSMGSGFIYARTRNVFGSILLHVLWQWPIILFR